MRQEDQVVLQNIAVFASSQYRQGLPVFNGQAAGSSDLQIPMVAAQIVIMARTCVSWLLTIPMQLRPGPPIGLIVTSGNVLVMPDTAFRGKVLHLAFWILPNPFPCMQMNPSVLTGVLC